MRGEAKECLSCGKLLKGRMDKKFCDNYCRNVFNNRRNSTRNSLVREVNGILYRNRRLLETVLRGSNTTICASRRALEENGFDFNYHTHLLQDDDGHTYFFCYEYGYLSIDEQWLLLIRKNAGKDKRMPVD